MNKRLRFIFSDLRAQIGLLISQQWRVTFYTFFIIAGIFGFANAIINSQGSLEESNFLRFMLTIFTSIVMLGGVYSINYFTLELIPKRKKLEKIRRSMNTKTRQLLKDYPDSFSFRYQLFYILIQNVTLNVAGIFVILYLFGLFY